MPEYIENRPTFIISKEETDPERIKKIQNLEQAIHENPESYLATTLYLGRMALLMTFEETEALHPIDNGISVEAMSGIHEYFKERFDLSMHFNEEIEDKLKIDEELRLKKARQDNLSNFKTIGVNNPAKVIATEKARDMVRIYRLEFFIRQVSLWDKQLLQQNNN